MTPTTSRNKHGTAGFRVENTQARQQATCGRIQNYTRASKVKSISHAYVHPCTNKQTMPSTLTFGYIAEGASAIQIHNFGVSCRRLVPPSLVSLTGGSGFLLRTGSFLSLLSFLFFEFCSSRNIGSACGAYTSPTCQPRKAGEWYISDTRSTEQHNEQYLSNGGSYATRLPHA